MYKYTLLWICFAVLCGGFLFHTSQQVNNNREILAALTKETNRKKDSIRVLEAEWGYLNQPARLERMAKKHLDLKPATAAQIVTIDDLDVPPPSAETKKKAKKTTKQAIKKPHIIAVPPPRLNKQVKKQPVKPAPRNSRSFADVMKNLEAAP